MDYEDLQVILAIITIIVVVALNRKIKKGEVNNDKLSAGEKIFTVIVGLLIPLVGVNGIIYYGIRKKYPTKAKEANKIGWIVLLIGIGLNVIILLFLAR